ncbi:MAG: PepSY domain-containing protein [Boseongicola sp.]
MTLKNYRMISTGILVGLIPAAAFANFAVGDSIGTDLDEIRAKFEAQGYTVTEIEVEDGEIEVEYVLDGQEYEVTLNPDSGEVLEVELEDDDD